LSVAGPRRHRAETSFPRRVDSVVRVQFCVLAVRLFRPLCIRIKIDNCLWWSVGTMGRRERLVRRFMTGVTLYECLFIRSGKLYAVLFVDSLLQPDHDTIHRRCRRYPSNPLDHPRGSFRIGADADCPPYMLTRFIQEECRQRPVLVSFPQTKDSRIGSPHRVIVC